MSSQKKIVVYTPAYNAERTIDKTLSDIPKDFVHEIIVVDNNSSDKTVEIAKSHGAYVVVHEENQGYGGSQKTGYKTALERGADVVVMVHSDFQYDPKLVPEMVREIVNGNADVCFGSRMQDKKIAWDSKMDWWRFVSNIGLTMIEELVLGLGISEYHSGYRAYSREALSKVSFDKNSNDYVFDTQMLAAISMSKLRVTEIPIPVRYFEDSQSPNFIQSCKYGFSTLKVLGQYLAHKLRLKKYPYLEKAD